MPACEWCGAPEVTHGVIAGMTDTTTTLVVAFIGLVGVAVGGIGNYLVQAHVRRAESERATEAELQAARAAGLALGEALRRATSLALQLQSSTWIAYPHWLTELDQQWQARREILAAHMSPRAFLNVAAGFEAADELNRQVRFRVRFTVFNLLLWPIALLEDQLKRKGRAGYYKRAGERIHHAATILVAFGRGWDVGLGSRAEISELFKSVPPEEADVVKDLYRRDLWYP